MNPLPVVIGCTALCVIACAATIKSVRSAKREVARKQEKIGEIADYVALQVRTA